MAKKDFLGGIDAMIARTNKTVEDKERIRKENETEKLTFVSFRMPTKLKIELEHYCTEKREKQQEAIAKAIEQYIVKK